MGNLNRVPDTTVVSYSINADSHYDSEGLEKFPASSPGEAGRGAVKDISGEVEARELTV